MLARNLQKQREQEQAEGIILWASVVAVVIAVIVVGLLLNFINKGLPVQYW